MFQQDFAVECHIQGKSHTLAWGVLGTFTSLYFVLKTTGEVTEQLPQQQHTDKTPKLAVLIIILPFYEFRKKTKLNLTWFFKFSFKIWNITNYFVSDLWYLVMQMGRTAFTILKNEENISVS